MPKIAVSYIMEMGSLSFKISIVYCMRVEPERWHPRRSPNWGLH